MSTAIPLVVLALSVRGGAALWGDARRGLARVGAWLTSVGRGVAARRIEARARREARRARDRRAVETLGVETAYLMAQQIAELRAECQALRSGPVSASSLPSLTQDN